jgi:threonine/homoserine/homoserine lactone efflux protein
MSFIEGLLLGLSTIVFIGPVFFLILQNTLAYGKLAGLYIALGILLSDIVYILLFKYSLYEHLSTITNSKYFYWGFSLLLFAAGISSMLKKKNKAGKLLKNSPTILFTKGFLINFVNPFVFLFWLGIYNYVQNKFPSNTEQIRYFTAAMISILAIDVVRILFSSYLKKRLTNSILKKLNFGIGILFICLSIYLLIQY